MVTTLGTSDGALEAVVSADNWLSALRAGRKELGEDGGVPQGASCVMSATGDVTILDAARRRRYVLVRAVPAEAIPRQHEADIPAEEPVAAEASEPSEEGAMAGAASADAPAASDVADAPALASAESDAPASEPEITRPVVVDPIPGVAADETGTLPPVPPTLLASLGVDLPPVAANHHAIAGAAEPADEPSSQASASVNEPEPSGQGPGARDDDPADPTSAGASPGLPRAKQTLAYSAMRAQALKREFETSRSISASAPAPSTPAPASQPAASDGAANARPDLHAITPERRGQGLGSSIPPAPKLPDDMRIRVPGESSRPRRGMPAAPRFDGLTPLGGRDTDPSPQSPLTYRERSYLVPRSADRERLEGLLQAQFTTLRRELAGKPRGQLIHLAVFDHSFDDRPLRPPIATLEWRDWRGDAVFVMAGEQEPAAPAPAAPAPRAPESNWPIPQRATAASPSTQVSRTSWPPAAQEAARASTSHSERAQRPSGAPLQPAHGATPFDAPATQPLSHLVAAIAPSSQPPFAQVAEGHASPRSSSAPPAAAANASSWPIPPQTPLEPARVLAAPWPAAPPLPEAPPPALQAPTLPSDPFPHASAVLSAADPFAPIAARSSTLDVFGPAKSPSSRPPAASAFGPPAARPSAADVFAPVPARPHTSDPFAPPPARAPATDPFGAPARPVGGDPFGVPAASASAGPQASDSFGPFDGRREPTGENDSRLATAFEAMPDLYFLPTPVAGLEFTIQLINRLVPSEAVSGCLYDINMDVFRFVVLTGPGAIERRAGAVSSQAGLFGVAKRTQHDSFVVKDLAEESRFDREADGREGLEIKNMAYLPVRYSGQLLGMMQLINREKDRAYSVSDLAVLSYVTAQLAEFLAQRRNLMG